MKWLLVCVLMCIAASAQAKVGDSCMTNTECGSNECCQIMNPILIMSKRAFVNTGTCQNYKQEGDTCSSSYISCSCGPGLKCYKRQEPIKSQLRMVMYVSPKPGYQWVSTCVKDN